MGYRSVLYLDDQRVPTEAGVVRVRSYREFVAYLRTREMPELISFDHDLAREHYPVGLNRAGERIPYGEYREETGLHCARYVVENGLDLKFWAVHSANVQGRINIERELRGYRRGGEVRGLEIPFTIPERLEREMDRPAARRPEWDERLKRPERVESLERPGRLETREGSERVGWNEELEREARVVSLAEVRATGFSGTSLLQFDGEFALESWESSLHDGAVKKR